MKKGDRSRQRLIQCAAELFWKNGYAATGLSEILRQTGLPKGSFYFYFKSKDELATAVIVYYQELFYNVLLQSSLPDHHAEVLSQRFLSVYRVKFFWDASAEPLPIWNRPGKILSITTMWISSTTDFMTAMIRIMWNAPRQMLTAFMRNWILSREATSFLKNWCPVNGTLSFLLSLRMPTSHRAFSLTVNLYSSEAILQTRLKEPAVRSAVRSPVQAILTVYPEMSQLRLQVIMENYVQAL